MTAKTMVSQDDTGDYAVTKEIGSWCAFVVGWGLGHVWWYSKFIAVSEPWDHSWKTWGVMGCRVSNLGQSLARQMPFVIYESSIFFFIWVYWLYSYDFNSSWILFLWLPLLVFFIWVVLKMLWFPEMVKPGSPTL